MNSCRKLFKRCLCCCLLIVIGLKPLHAQADFNIQSVIYNCLVGGLSGGLGAVINKGKDDKHLKVFARGFVTGTAGGAIMYSGKKLNFLVSQKQHLGYAWLSRAVYSAGNSIVENAACNIPFWSRWHYDLSFVRLEYDAREGKLQPRFMPSSFVTTVFMSIYGRPDFGTSLRSGTLTFRTKEIAYAPRLIGSTAGNGFLLNDTLRSGLLFHDVYAHEMNHAFQFQDLSGMNYFFGPWIRHREARRPVFAQVHRWVYGDLNYGLMLMNYFLVNGGASGSNYCRNFLENEAEFLSVGRMACP